MKSDKKFRAEHIIQMTKRFNDGSRLVGSEIVSRYYLYPFTSLSHMLTSNIFFLSLFKQTHRCNMAARVAAIEKWTAVADICRCLHNFNGVLQICAAFTSAPIFRMKKTWDKVPKNVSRHDFYFHLTFFDVLQIKSTITKLQAVVCSDGRFRVMREALHRCDPPCIPYLGMYLTDLSFIEEGTPDFTPDGLLNFSKMRMVSEFTNIKIHQSSQMFNYCC